MNLDEALSRLLEGDLPDEEASQLWRRIDTEPDVARAWEAMTALPDALAGLPPVPGDVAPPPLAEAVYDALPKPESRRVAWAQAIPWVVAALALLYAAFGGSSSDPTERVELVAGESLVEGQLSLVAADRSIALDGRARIFVEPMGPVTRGERRTPISEDSMDARPLLGAVAGAMLTITVYEGSAVVQVEDGASVTVAAGEQRVFSPVGGAERAVPAAEPGTPERAQELAQRVEALNAELEAARKALDTERFAGALVRGQLQAERGTPSEWPDDGIPEAVRPDTFEASLAEALAGTPDVEVDRVDCTEYPCIAVLAYTGEQVSGDAIDWNQVVGRQVGEWTQDVLGDGHSISMNSSRFRNGDQDARYVLFGAHGSGGEAVGDRTDWRMDQLVDVLGDELKE